MGRKNARAVSTRVFSASSSGGGKRKQRREPQAAVDDTYTFDEKLPKRHRTSAQQLSLTREEAAERPGREEDEDEDMAARIRRVAMQIAGDDGAEVGESDDEDIDSDEAWEEDGSDEERWGDVFSNLKKGKGKKGREVVMKPAKPLNVNLDETDEESDPEVERSPRTAFKSAFPDEEGEGDEDGGEEEEEMDGDEEMADEDEEEDEDDDDDEEVFDEDPELPSDLSDDDEDAGLDGLDAFVDSLASADKKRKADTGEPAAKKRRVLPVQAAPGVGDGDLALKSKTKVDLASLISSNPALSGASALLPSKTDKKSSSVLKSGVLPAPLPTVVQDRLDREAAYEKTREEGQKWSGLMKRVKEAEHLSFPLQAKARGGNKSAGEVIASFKPEGELESAVDALLSAANLTDKGVAAAEDEALRGQDLSPEEIEARRAELRYQRELMFRAEQKAKYVSKIKSKTFRKLARKRKAKAAADGVSLEDLERLDPDAAEEERERLERERARERATLRHGARSRFGRGADGEGTEAEAAERRSQRVEMLELRDKLQRKIQGRDSGESSESDSGDSGDEGDEEAIKARAFDQLAALDKAEAPAGKKGLMQMKFMQKAQERRMREVADEAEALRRDIDMFGEEKESESEDEDAAQVLKLGEGRMVFSGPGEAGDAPAKAGTDKADKAEVKEVSRYEPSLSPESVSNPWLDASASAGPSRKKNAVNKSSEAKAVRALKKAARPKDEDVDAIEISVDVGKKLSRAEKKAAASASAAAPADADSSDDELLPASGVKAFTQRALVAEAFAGDDVVADFTAEKQAAIDADAPQTVDTTLPGWGGWGGKGVRQRKKKRTATTAGVSAEARKDAGRANVIISEKKDRKAAKFLPTDLPFPFTSVRQYEAQFANPVGSEWNARAGFQRQTMPRVTKKPGAIIEPIRRLF
ncbi:Utp14-domain-containing protein [Cutaneotrichosporon oleaginosum]|uniref:Utp14-domain-containing protein n=1 Tax=Cutaneotrichosporon oleaginosum TaxID=879819 RepID=A0A0J0XVV1_9TREE|nr:Utp14-domain-containing protein [Cutaneotrichosporon oleaginosum]KLT45158.1 Utp14-domain-containing protein [Cutaneotrichosporon oleaginosum]TXT15004.1 hypothetical protein COLE_01197 [Cutaneotrichosporon oleaginosum]